MNRKIIYSLIVLILAFAACEKDQLTENKVDEQTVDNFLTVNKKYKEVKSITQDFRSFGFKKAKLKAFKTDTLDGDSTWVDDDSTWFGDWESCADITEEILDDGGYKIVIDYGEEGCDEFGEHIKGKITIIWHEENFNFTCTETYENLSYEDMVIDGTVTYSSSFSDNMMSGDMVWEGSEDLTFTFGDEVITMKGTFKELMTDETYSVTEGSYEFSSSKGYSYSYKITKPLVYLFSCEDAWIPVEGTEEISYTEDGETFDFVVDYGDGTCDNIYTVTSNGETIEYNYEDEWSDDGDNWDDTDSTNVSG